MEYTRSEQVHKAHLIERINRFVVLVKFNSNIIRCHLPNPGRMVNLLYPGHTVVLFVPTTEGSSRKTDGTVVGVLRGSEVINLDTLIFSELLKFGISNNTIPLFEKWEVVASEKTFGTHRFDFVFLINGEEVITEVKSTTRVIDGIACFPDAVSKRASDHITALYHLYKQKNRVKLIFLVFQEANWFSPCQDIDPIFTSLFWKYQQHLDVSVIQVRSRLDETDHIKYRFVGELPIISLDNI